MRDGIMFFSLEGLVSFVLVYTPLVPLIHSEYGLKYIGKMGNVNHH
jgi:hypothetical protein